MSEIHIRSSKAPFTSHELARQAVEVISTADAMGLLEGTEIQSLDLPSFRQIVDRIAKAGIGTEIQTALSVQTPAEGLTAGEMGRLLERLAVAIEESPSPAHEWPALEALFGTEALAKLVGISSVTLRRYRDGARTTPDRVAVRLHFLATLVGHLAGAYNEIGIRQWFERRRTQLGGRRPVELLKGDWAPDDDGARQVRQLARSLSASAAT